MAAEDSVSSLRPGLKAFQSVTWLKPRVSGEIAVDDVAQALRPDTVLISLMHVNNETGAIQPIEAIGELCHKKGVLFMSDTTQAIGKVQIGFDELPVDIILGSAHKIYGPKGVGFLMMKKERLANLAAQVTGGGQEFGKRAGTINLSGIVGLSVAVSLATERLSEDSQNINKLRDHFESELARNLTISLNGSIKNRLYNTSNICFTGHDSERVMQAIGNKVAASRGSACSTERIEPSHVLSAMGLTNDQAHASVRFSFGRYTTKEEVNRAIDYIVAALASG